jgi:hypothetical protein
MRIFAILAILATQHPAATAQTRVVILGVDHSAQLVSRAYRQTLKFYTKEDQELSIECRTASGPLRVAYLESSGDEFVIVHGFDEAENQTFHCAPYSMLEITMKIVASMPDARNLRLAFSLKGES